LLHWDATFGSEDNYPEVPFLVTKVQLPILHTIFQHAVCSFISITNTHNVALY